MRAVNLIPSDERRRGRSVTTGLPFLGLAGGLVIVLVATALFVIAHNRVETKRSQLAAIQASSARWSAAAASYGRDVAAAKQRETTIGSVEGLVGERADWAKLLGQLAAVMPADSQISSLTAAAAAASAAPAASASSTTPTTTSSTATATSPTASTSTNSPIQLSACATSQSVVAQAMVSLRRITGVSNVALASSNKSSSGSGSNGCSYPVSFSVTLAFTPPTTSSDVVTGTAASDTSVTNGSSRRPQ